MKRSLLHSGAFLFTSVLIIVPFLYSCMSTVRPHPKSVMMDDKGAYFTGRWRVTVDSGLAAIPKVNTTTCNCNKLSMKCREVTAKLYNPGRHYEFLSAEEINYDVIEWTETSIRGVAELPVANVEISISLLDNRVEKTYIENKTRGSDDAKITRSYILE